MIGVIPRGRATLSIGRLSWLAYTAVVAVLLACYASIFRGGIGGGVDFACFRAAAVVLSHGGNPYDFGQLWRVENALYNVPQHLHPGAPAYYYLDRYYNPPLFATLLTPLTHLPLAAGNAIYGACVTVFVAAGAWFMLAALGWTRRRALAIGLVLVSPSVFLAVWNGQQSTLLLCALGASLYALRCERPGLAGALLALTWVKPHLLIPFALAAPLLLPSSRAMLRWYAGLAAATLAGVVLTVLTTGAASIVAWLHTLVGYTGYADAIQTYMPSLSGMSLILLPHPWNKALALALMAVGMAVMALAIAGVRRGQLELWSGLGILVAAWLLFTPFAHANDDVLLCLPLAVAWSRGRAAGLRLLPPLALWSFSTLPLAFLLPAPFQLLGILPPALALVAVAAARREPIAAL